MCNQTTSKNPRFFLFTVLLMIFSYVPMHALFDHPAFNNDRTKQFHFKNQAFKINTSFGFKNSKNLGYPSLIPQEEVLENSVYDLYLGFDNNNYTDNYTVSYMNFEKNDHQKVTGSVSAKFISGNHFIMLFPSKNSILQNQTSSLQSFTISFALYPYRVGEGTQTIADYICSNSAIESYDRYGFKITIEKGIVHYHFINFFQDEKGNHYSFILKEDSALINDTWERHSIILDPASKTIRSFRNDIEQDVQIITDNNKIFGTQLLPSHVLTKSQKSFPLIIGQNSMFCLDEFAIYRDIVTDYSHYKPHHILFLETDVFTISQNISFLQKMYLKTSQSNQNNYRLGYRISKKYFLPSTSSLDMPWVYIDLSRNMFPPSQSTGQYLQWRVEYHNPATPEPIPHHLEDIVLEFQEHSAPGSVWINSVIARDNEVEISWKSLPNTLISNYEIYYGTLSEHYFGTSSVSPISPININITPTDVSEKMSYTIKGIDNEKEYFISIRAKNIYGQYGPFAQEFSSRPSSTKNPLGYSIGR